MTQIGFDLGKGFMAGVSAAATQIEGGSLRHSWNDWAAKGHIKDGTSPERATDHVNRWKEDIDLMAGMGIKAYRLGIEWARLEPEEGVFDKEAVNFYRELLKYLKERDIKPLMTLHHFTNPMWFEEKGGFAESRNIKAFMRFVVFAVKSFADLVNEFVTINEPNVYATNSYFYGTWPPGGKSFGMAMAVMSNLAACHILAYKTIHKIRAKMGFKNTKVGFAHHLRVFEPENPKNPVHRIGAAASHYIFQTIVTEAFYKGRFLPPLANVCGLEKGEYSDFIAVNYYSRSTVKGVGDGVKKDAPLNDLGWEIYPYGIVRCAAELYKSLSKPIYITENGCCDNNDSFRCRYIYDHLKALACSGLPVRRYYHWCFCDNFEWLEGESARFGLIHMNYETQKRTVKKSGLFYSEIIKNNGVTNEMYEKYVKSQNYHK